MRLDSYLCNTGQAVSRTKAQQLIKMNKVSVNGRIQNKSSYDVGEDDEVNVSGNIEFASMGGYKLDKAIKEFGIDLNNKVCIDIGASNGGFTDCMLRAGASKVYAVDVGDCALEDNVRYDPKVIIKDRLNAREIVYEDIGEYADFISIDVSFIPLRLVLANVLSLLNDKGICVALIKPQFECGKNNLTKKGIVIDKNVHKSVINSVIEYISALGFNVSSLTNAPLREGKNIEYLIKIVRDGKMFDLRNVSEFTDALWKSKQMM